MVVVSSTLETPKLPGDHLCKSILKQSCIIEIKSYCVFKTNRLKFEAGDGSLYSWTLA